MLVLETERLALRRFEATDAAFIRELVNEPSWLQYIGDRNVRTLDDARAYIANGPVSTYERVGYGLYRTELRASGEPIGMCGLVVRDTLPHSDLGFAFLPRYWGQGYAFEAAMGVLRHARDDLRLDRVLAITVHDNDPSIRLLERCGFRRGERELEQQSERLLVYGLDLSALPDAGV